MKYYGVKVGRKCNVVVNSWEKCERLVHGFSGSKFKAFKNKDDAIKFAGKRSSPKARKKKIPPESINSEPMIYTISTKGKGDCLGRGMFEGSNRCLIRDFGITTGINFVAD